MALTLNRFIQRPPGRVVQAHPATSAHSASMIAQASRVPRLANLNARSSGHTPAKGRR